MILALVAAAVLAATPSSPAATTGPVARSATVAPFTVPLAGDAFPVGFAGDGVLLAGRRSLRLATPDGTRRLVRADGFIGAAGSETRVIAVSGSQGVAIADCVGGCPLGQGEGDGYGESQGAADTSPSDVFVGPGRGPLTKVDHCRGVPAVGVPPVATGDTVAYRGCDGASIVVLDAATTARDTAGSDVVGAGRRVAAGGTVVALAAEGRRLAWVAVRDGATSLVRTLDLDTGAVTDVGELKPLSTGPALTLSLAPGRLRVALTRQYGAGKRACRILDATTGPLAPVDTTDCTRGRLTASGSVGVVDRTIRRPASLVAHGEPGGSNPRVLARLDDIFPVVAPDRVAFLRASCSGPTLVVRDLTSPGTITAAPCRVRPVRRTVTLSARGGTVALRCPDGCAVPAATLAFGRHERAVTEGGRAVPGGVLRLRFTFNRKARADLARRPRSFPGRVRLEHDGYGATTVRIRLRRAAG